MKRFLLCVLLLTFFFVAAGSAEDRRPDKSVLTIMTFNGQFLWDGVAPEESSADFPWKGSQTEAEEHMRRVADIIIRSDPDLINLVEVENIAALRAFNDKFLAGRGYRPYLDQGLDSATGQDVALLTRVDPENDSVRHDPRLGHSGPVSKSVSKNYVARFVVGDTKFSLIGLHFLAFPLSQQRRPQRQAQADAVRAMASDERAAGFPPVVLGDFNDYDGEEASRDHADSLPVTSVLAAIRAMEAGVASDGLFNVSALAAKADRYTAFHDANRNDRVDPPGELTSIDHILLSPELRAKAESADFPHGHDPVAHPDHFPVVVRLRLSGGAAAAPSGVRIVSLLPNPAGDENQNERAVLKNFGAAPVDLSGWKLRDLAGKTWSLSALGTLAPNTQKTVMRNGQPMALNNGGDTVDLLDSAGRVVQTLTYGEAEEGEVVIPPP